MARALAIVWGVVFFATPTTTASPAFVEAASEPVGLTVALEVWAQVVAGALTQAIAP